MTLPAEMAAVVITAPGGPEVLQVRQLALPPLGEHDILIEVAAAGINRADAMQRQGKYRLPPMPEALRDIPGLEAAGTVVAIGGGVTRWRIGDTATALLLGGGYAQYAVADEGAAMPVPRGLSLLEAAGLPECAMTVWNNLVERGRLAAGDIVLVHGGSSGIGSMAIQLGVALGARVIATAGSAEKCAACLGMGAFAAINYRDGDFTAAARDASGGHGADVILDMVGGDYVDKNIAVAAEDGRIVNVSFMGGARVTADLGLMMSKRLTLSGSTLRNRPAAFKAELAARVVQRVWPLVEAGQIRPVIDSTFNLGEAGAAHRRLDSGKHIGKVMLEVQ